MFHMKHFGRLPPKNDNPRGEKKQLFKLFICFNYLKFNSQNPHLNSPKTAPKKHDYFSNKILKRSPKNTIVFLLISVNK